MKTAAMRWSGHFVPAVSFILMATAFLKLFSVFSGRAGSGSDPVFATLPEADVALVAGILELAFGILLSTSWLSERRKAIAIFWTAAAFVSYRVAGQGAMSACGCLGKFAEPGGAMNAVLAGVSLGLLAFLFLGGLAKVITEYRLEWDGADGEGSARGRRRE